MTLTEFLLARIAEDEAVARSAIKAAGAVWTSKPRDHSADVHIARHDPARVLAECAAKRAIVEDFEDYGSEYRKAPSDFAAGRRHATLLAVTRLAAIYSGHPDYRQEWQP